MILTIVWALVGVLLGLCLLIVVPWTAARIAGLDWIEGVSDRYVWLAQTCARRSALIVRDGDVDLVPKRYDSDLKGDKDTSTGDKRHHFDSFDVIGRLKNKVFGMGLTSRDTYVSPLLAELGEEAKRAVERQEIGREESRGTDKMVDGIHIPKRSRLVDLSAAKYITTGSSEPEDGQESYKKTKISQEKFHERVSFGQGMLIITAFIGSAAAMWFGASRSGGGGTEAVQNTTTVSFLTLLAIPAARDVVESINERIPWSKVAAWLWIGLWIIGIPVIAGLTYGLGTALLVSVAMVATSLGILMIIGLFAPSFPVPLGMALARGWWILAQLTVGRGVFVERDSGELEHHQLQDAPEDADHRFETRLSDGKMIPIEGSKGDLIRFAWAPIAATAEKSDQNMRSITDEFPEDAATDGGEIMPTNQRQGFDPAIRVPDGDEWIVTLPQLYNFCENSCESQAVRQGRQKALTEHGGEQQISMLIFLVILLGAAVIGGLFGLIAGGAIL